MNRSILDTIQARHPGIIYKNNNLFGKIYQTTFKEIKHNCGLEIRFIINALHTFWSYYKGFRRYGIF